MESNLRAFKIWRAWFVHFYTALGLICSFLALMMLFQGRLTMVVYFLAAAMFIDGTDGMMARGWEVKRWLPQFDGRKLDDITDFLNYTFIPLFIGWQLQLLAGNWAIAFGVALLASAYGFSNETAKTEDGFFTGFPSYWNMVMLYLYWLNWPDWLGALVVVILALLTFLPTRYISMNQTRQLKKTHVVLFFLWTFLFALMLMDFQSPAKWLVYLSLFYPAFYMGASFYLHYQIERNSES